MIRIATLRVAPTRLVRLPTPNRHIHGQGHYRTPQAKKSHRH